jgi:hypothetical protein
VKHHFVPTIAALMDINLILQVLFLKLLEDLKDILLNNVYLLLLRSSLWSFLVNFHLLCVWSTILHLFLLGVPSASFVTPFSLEHVHKILLFLDEALVTNHPLQHRVLFHCLEVESLYHLIINKQIIIASDNRIRARFRLLVH